ncbi:MAG: GtrA family protein, partial [Lactobacillus iners]|nr:GtrA family protein [Lactobacillus iners]
VFNYLTTRSVFQKQEHTMIERAKMRIQEQKNKRDSKN